MLVRLFLTAVLAAGLASAQRGATGGGEGPIGEGIGMNAGGGAGGGMPGGMRRQSKEDLFFDKLKLNKDQKEEAAKIMSAAREKAAPVREQLSKGRQLIVGLIMQKRDDDVKKLMGDYAIVAAQMTAIETEAFSKIYAQLKPNQQSKAPQAFEMMAGIFAGGGMPGGGAGGRGRGQGQGGGRN
ncbi:MAG: hypothetical protein JWP63_6099 [Candidatus Solibacter sp.]|jgi:Spy/CpxP family protein refolding chaperone|nr:hypothetical protein [Candidatus Solibacter sp.]